MIVPKFVILATRPLTLASVNKSTRWPVGILPKDVLVTVAFMGNKQYGE